MYKYLLVACFIMAFALAANAQRVDTARATKADTLRKASNTASGSFAPPIKKEKEYHPDSTHSPHKAVMRSLMIPGWGQLYNRSWWWVPVIYGGMGLLTSAVIFNQHYYTEFVTLSKYRRGSLPAPTKPTDKYYAEYIAYTGIPDQNIYDTVDGYRRNRDLSILGLIGAWGIQTVQAYIDAKFINAYTVDNNLSMQVTPSLISQPVYAQSANSTYIPAVKITFTF
ncbi:MAG: hypothetical protein JWP94_3610 [Mucilaginibacter sp.]|nr:hypothetical protein [Mucilaginibacter sp.]